MDDPRPGLRQRGKEAASVSAGAWTAIVIIIIAAVVAYLVYAQKQQKWPFTKK